MNQNETTPTSRATLRKLPAKQSAYCFDGVIYRQSLLHGAMDAKSSKYSDVITRKSDVKLAHKLQDTRKKLCTDLTLPKGSAFNLKAFRVKARGPPTTM